MSVSWFGFLELGVESFKLKWSILVLMRKNVKLIDLLQFQADVRNAKDILDWIS